MKKIRNFAQLLKVIWTEDIHHWLWWHTIGKWRVSKHIKEGRCLKCGQLIESDNSHCDHILI